MNERAPIELRTASIREVDYPGRIVELIAVPYDQWTPVDIDGRMVEESFAPGAFDGVQRRTSRFQVNLDHNKDQWVGRVVALDPDHATGLRAELQIRRGDTFEQVLMDAADGMLCGSVGFGARPSDQQWEGRTRRRINKAYLDHIALTPTPAYLGAEVLSVRHSAPTVTTSTTPNLDRILAERAAAAYGDG